MKPIFTNIWIRRATGYSCAHMKFKVHLQTSDTREVKEMSLENGREVASNKKFTISFHAGDIPISMYFNWLLLNGSLLQYSQRVRIRSH